MGWLNSIGEKVLLKICVLSTHKNGGGAFLAAKKQYESLACSKDFSVVDFISLDVESNIRHKLIFYCNFITDRIIKKIAFPNNPIFHSSNLFGAIKAKDIDSKNYDLLIIHWFSNGLISLQELNKVKTPYILNVHDSWLVCGMEHHPKNSVFSNKWLDRLLISKKESICKNAKGIVYPSKWQKKVFADRGQVAERSYVISNFLDMKEKISSESKDNIVRLGVVAQRAFTNKAKGSDLLIDILSGLNEYLSKASLTVELFVVGKKSKNFDEINKFSNISIFELGSVENDKINEFYSKIDIFINPSLFENLSTTNIEACFFGVPIICFDVGGNSEMVKNEYNGFLITPYSIKDFSSAIFKSIYDGELRSSQSKLSINMYKKFSDEFVYEQTFKMIKDVNNGK